VGLLTNIRLGWKYLSGTNILAYWAHLFDVKKIKCCDYNPSFIMIKIFLKELDLIKIRKMN